MHLKEMALAGDPRALDRLLRLAQFHNDEVQIPVAETSADDQTVLTVYNARVRSGAVASARTKTATARKTTKAPRDKVAKTAPRIRLDTRAENQDPQKC